MLCLEVFGLEVQVFGFEVALVFDVVNGVPVRRLGLNRWYAHRISQDETPALWVPVDRQQRVVVLVDREEPCDGFAGVRSGVFARIPVEVPASREVTSDCRPDPCCISGRLSSRILGDGDHRRKSERAW